MKQDSKRLSSVIIAGFLLVAAVVVYFELIIPAYSQLQDDKGQDLSEKTLYNNEKQIVTQVQSLLNTYQTQSAASQAVGMALPVGQNSADAITQIYGIATNSGLSLKNIAIETQAVTTSPVPNTTVPNSQIADAAAGGSIVKPTGTLSFEITAVGSYEAFKTFLDELQTNIRIFDVTAISIEPTVQALTIGKAQPTSEDQFNYDFTVVTHYQAP